MTLNIFGFFYLSWKTKTEDFDFSYKALMYFINGFIVSIFSFLLYDIWSYSGDYVKFKLVGRNPPEIKYELAILIYSLNILIFIIPIILVTIIELNIEKKIKSNSNL